MFKNLLLIVRVNVVLNRTVEICLTIHDCDFLMRWERAYQLLTWNFEGFVGEFSAYFFFSHTNQVKTSLLSYFSEYIRTVEINYILLFSFSLKKTHEGLGNFALGLVYMEGSFWRVTLALPSLRKLGVERGGSNPLIRLLPVDNRTSKKLSLLNNPTGKKIKQAHISVPGQVGDIYVLKSLIISKNCLTELIKQNLYLQGILQQPEGHFRRI